jgi:hypothetical protein
MICVFWIIAFGSIMFFVPTPPVTGAASALVNNAPATRKAVPAPTRLHDIGCLLPLFAMDDIAERVIPKMGQRRVGETALRYSRGRLAMNRPRLSSSCSETFKGGKCSPYWTAVTSSVPAPVRA